MTLLTDALTAYLAPLLKKHGQGEALVWEDLEASRSASLEVLKKNGNAFVSKRIDDLHQTQVQAYREAAVKGLREWAQSEAPLEPMEDNDTEDAFVERCVTAALVSWPNWRLDSAKMVIVIEIRKRARAVFAKYHPSVDDMVDSSTSSVVKKQAVDIVAKDSTTVTKNDPHPDGNNDDENNEEVEENEDGEVDEDGDMDDDDEADDDGAVDDNDNDQGEEDGQVNEDSAKKSSAGPKKKNLNSNKNKKKKVMVRKKGTIGKPSGLPRKGGGPSNRGRRVGRGGSNAGSTKSG